APAGPAVVKPATRDPEDAYLSAAVLSSLNQTNIAAALDAARSGLVQQSPGRILSGLLATAVALDQREATAAFLRAAAAPRDGRIRAWQMTALAALLDAVERRGLSLEKWLDDATLAAARGLFENAQKAALDESAGLADRLAAVSLLNREPARREADEATLERLLAV